MLSGSYDPGDVTFLLKRVELAPTAIADKERLIQSGRRHYSEMISHERLPSPAYLRVFHAALARNKVRFARHLLTLAQRLAVVRPDDIVLVSLARAGTPVGVLLARLLRQLHRTVHHYSISIIRDRGLDAVALKWILARHAVTGVAFVDGWTGKGVIAAELLKSVTAFNESERVQLDAGLFAVADLCGAAAEAATSEDYLIPSSVLGCTISGLVSRSILNRDVIGPGDFHGCLFYEEYREHDLSRWFIDEVLNAETTVTAATIVTPEERGALRRRNAAFLQSIQRRYMIRDVNHIKPGIGEATRVLLRRVPDRLLLREPDHEDVAHLRLLAEEKGVPTEVDRSLPYLAAALIKELGE